ncbi:hypothetical protein BGZ63DRAFT_421787 [Mariannaea sp. PMI_226]|nr:hypothetical protein BGZ63DRAFT_421787 [Mariannaea sp. PMI_226]
MVLSTTAIPFLLHAIIETPAALSFIIRPSSQLSPLHPDAALILQSFGGLLLASNLIAIIFIRRPFDDVARHVAAALAFWHMWPCYRAFVRLQRMTESNPESNTEGDGNESTSPPGTLGGPLVHLAVHLLLFFMFASSYFLGFN